MSDCGKCGQVHIATLGGRPCTGHISTGPKSGPMKERAGQPCTKPAMKGLQVCASHGGRAPSVKAKGRARVAQAKTEALARKLIPDAEDRTPITNPLERLLDLASELDGFRESLRLLANDIQGEIRYRGAGAGTEQLRAEVALYASAAKDVTNLLVAIARLDIESMLARVTVAQAEQSIAALRAGMDEAELDEDQRRKVMAGVGRHLRAVAG